MNTSVWHIAILLAASGHAGVTPTLAQDGKQASTVFEARFVDGAVMNVLLRDERLNLDTRFGPLSVRASEIRRIDFALRLPLEVRQRIDSAVQALADKDVQKRDAAMFTLFDLKENAYPFLVQAAKGTDPAVADRALRVIEKLREIMSLEQLNIPSFDIIWTDDARLPGRIVGDSLRVTTVAFGDQDVSLMKLRLLRSPNAEQALAPNALPDPGTLMRFEGAAGKSLAFQVTAPPFGSIGERGVYGTDVYSLDSSLARAAVHAGALQAGQTGIVRVTLVGPQQVYHSSLRNGIASSAYGPWPGFRFDR